MKVLSIVGARPEFVQAAPLTRALRPKHQEVLVHTGQHYDYQMSQVFFQDLAIPAPDVNLGVGSGPHGRQTGEMLAGLEMVLLRERPDWVIVRGDTNSTLAGALAASKLGVPLAHVESGARSYDRSMPEEINRLVADRVADLLFCVAPSAVDNLRSEGIAKGVHYIGDVMLDAVQSSLPLARATSRIHQRLGVKRGEYVLATVHRAANTDNPERLRGIVDGLNAVPDTVVFPVHPRTRQALDMRGLTLGSRVRAIEPVGYLDMLALEEGARVIATDSGGVTREAYFLGVPCVTLREETEHVETVMFGWNTLVGADPQRIARAIREFRPTASQPPVFGDGTAAKRIVEILVSETLLGSATILVGGARA
jgi:UDP-N-acetylglucosamine 2-epimerase